MSKLTFLASFILTVALVFVLDNSYHTRHFSVPALGKFLNPVSGFWKNAERVSPISKTASMNSTSIFGDIKVVYDNRLVPHIFAKNTVDAYFAQGYVTAQHRLWQMDFMVRGTAGRLSEVVGEKALKLDQRKRRIGLPFAAENTLKVWQSDSAAYALAEAYARGVNAYIESLEPADYPLEFKLLDYSPEKWTPLHTALVTKAMAESLCLRAHDVKATNAKALFGEEVFQLLYPAYFREQRPIISDSTAFLLKKPALSDDDFKEKTESYLGALDLEVSDENIGSNNWAIAPEKSSSGKAILAGDPHLMLTLPSIWFELQIHTPDMNAYGVSIPGMPGVTIGFNENVAWSMTNTGLDVADFYALEWQDSTKQAYLLDSQWLKVEKRVEKFGVRKDYGLEEVVDTVRFTNWGPVVTQNDSLPDLAMRWLAHDAPARPDIDVFLGLNQAKNKEEFERALENYASPSQNIAFASTNGEIGLFIKGDWPLKKEGQGRFIQDGTQSEQAWQGLIPKDDMPKVVNPSWNYVSSANQHPTHPGYPYYYNSEYFEAYRGRYIDLQLAPDRKFSEEEMRKLQLDNYSLKTEELFDLMVSALEVDSLNATEKDVLESLKKWDYRYERESMNPVYFEEWFNSFYIEVWDEVAESKYENILYPAHWRTVYLLRDDPENAFFDIQATPKRENCQDLLKQTFGEMVEKITNRLLTEPDLNWSNYRNTKVAHLARIDAFSKQKIYTGGYRRALNAVTSKTGPSWRMVVEMDAIPKAKVVYPGGQSGNPGSPFYADFLDEWAEGVYFDARFLQSAEELAQPILVQNFKVKKNKGDE